MVQHPFFVNNAWVAAKDLNAGDSLFSFSGTKLRIDSLSQFKTDIATTVYNLEVAGNNDFYISVSVVLVHNCNKIVNTSELFGTKNLTTSKKEFERFVELVKKNGVTEPIKYVEFQGIKYIVDGHHRAAAARKLGLTTVPAQKVTLPYKGYKRTEDLFWE